MPFLKCPQILRKSWFFLRGLTTQPNVPATSKPHWCLWSATSLRLQQFGQLDIDQVCTKDKYKYKKCVQGEHGRWLCWQPWQLCASLWGGHCLMSFGHVLLNEIGQGSHTWFSCVVTCFQVLELFQSPAFFRGLLPLGKDSVLLGFVSPLLHCT